MKIIQEEEVKCTKCGSVVGIVKVKLLEWEDYYYMTLCSVCLEKVKKDLDEKKL